jgi:hypothetical protein
MSWTNSDAVHRHACHAYGDFRKLRKLLRDDVRDDGLLHSLSHHLRHVVFRSGHEVDDDRVRVKDVRRASVDGRHR